MYENKNIKDLTPQEVQDLFKRSATMQDGQPYNLADFNICKVELNGAVIDGLKHKSGFWFALDTLKKGYKGVKPLYVQLLSATTITRTHIVRYVNGKEIKERFFTFE